MFRLTTDRSHYRLRYRHLYSVFGEGFKTGPSVGVSCTAYEKEQQEVTRSDEVVGQFV